ncbi:PilZ domain-containing protein [Sphingomicrobium aestuariivivum]|uniref:PilZ domain-containing protein n=1 Tax=Sphingomicrobium aestuariivivum TaxID=1582356 RepID=UPI001FD6BFE3|nr:PilZ domain-containing protein [Sphingomicrobium aestuariivivum]MCJ8191841.1 PilZ domain-containing protein [Sphingomicrobium aestuariivivum]
MRRKVGEVKRAKRIEVNHEGVLVASDGVESPVTVIDLSAEGCRLKTDGTPMIGEDVRLRVGRSGDYPAQVRWALGDEAGLRFTGPAEPPA